MKKYTVLFAFTFVLANLFANIHYVTQTGAGLLDGSSWSNAAPGVNLQAIIDAANPGDSVWVACGTYAPTLTADRNVSFHMREGISIFGSFMGTESLLDERQIALNGLCTILSGEIGTPGIADNSYTVVYNQDLTNSAILDGFIIRDGNDDRSPTSNGNGLGGGLYNHGYGVGGFCHPTVRNCVFTNNRASWGGGAFNNGYASGNAEPTYFNCVFDANHAYIEAGGMDSYGVGGNASPTLYNCIFYHNTSATNVGAMYCWGGNNGGNCHPTLINCAFVNNRALNGYGGAIIAENLDENLTTSSGSCTVTVQNCIFWGNVATGEGQQFYIRGTGAEFLATYSDVDLTGQSAPHLISGTGTGNIEADPLFMDSTNARGGDNLWLTFDDGLQLSSNSPCINVGNNTGVSMYDALGNQRIWNNVDMGPYEVLMDNLYEFDGAELRVYPNPSTDVVTIELLDYKVETTYELCNFQGKTLVSGVLDSDGKGNLNLSGLAPGIYVIKVRTENLKTKVQRIILQ